jgi:hypothetical protein
MPTIAFLLREYVDGSSILSPSAKMFLLPYAISSRIIHFATLKINMFIIFLYALAYGVSKPGSATATSHPIL